MDRDRELELIAAYLRAKPPTTMPVRWAAQFSSRRERPKGETYIARKPLTFRSPKRRK
jgi:hypothetical protein